MPGIYPVDDLNPIRAGLLNDPLDYLWCGYAEAVVGGHLARCGLSARIRGEVGDDEFTRNWPQIQAIYRCWLYDEGKVAMDEAGQVIRRGLARTKSRESWPCKAL